jgi:hypothetical protein
MKTRQKPRGLLPWRSFQAASGIACINAAPKFFNSHLATRLISLTP